MPLKDKKDLLVILDNLDEFSGKLLSQIANESEAGRQHLLQSIAGANDKYNKPIEAHITGWFYYFSRIRGLQVKKLIEDIEVEADPIKRLEAFKTLLNEGKWNIGSFNYYLFLELINAVPGYEPLDDESSTPVIKRLNSLLVKKIDVFIAEFKLNQRLIEEREKGRQAIKNSQDSLNNVVLYDDLLSAQHAAKVPFKKVSFYLVKEDSWKLSWVDSTGTPFSLKLNQELETFLNEHGIEKIEKVNAVVAKRIKKECLKIRDAFFEKTQVLINPKHPKTGVELSNEELSTQGVTASFVVRGQASEYGISWVNTLGKAVPIALESYPELRDFLSCQDAIEGEDLIQLKAHLVQVKTTHAIGMSDFKTKLQDCLLRRPAAAKETQAAPSKRLDLGLFKDLERCLGRQAGKSQESELAVPEKPRSKVVQTGKLKLSEYSAITTLFAHRAEEAPETRWVDDKPLSIIDNHW